MIELKGYVHDAALFRQVERWDHFDVLEYIAAHDSAKHYFSTFVN